uniref:Putative ovule protein n=1 Tax=Solanum chacoense TaxID=4108 RepID=A0A0V0H5F4_SOLCH
MKSRIHLYQIMISPLQFICSRYFGIPEFFSSESNFANSFKDSSFVPPVVSNCSNRPVFKFTLETGFFNKFVPISTNLSMFSLVDMSTEESAPLNVSS